MIAVSACLLGYNCRYDGKNRKDCALIRQLESEKILPICPEQLGGLPTPRHPSNLVNGDGFDILDGKARVVSIDGVDNTEAFINGAYAALDRIEAFKIKRCFLKGKSPSCGVGRKTHLHTGAVGQSKSGSAVGVTAALLIRKGIEVEEVEERQ